MKRFVMPLVVLGVVAALLWRYPPVRIVNLAEVEASKREQAFDAADYARRVWDEQLKPILGTAHDAAEVAAAIRQDPREARTQFGRTMGVGRGYFLFLRGEGVVVSADSRQIGLSLGGGEEVDVVLRVGPLFGNAVRDATGLVDASDFSNSQHFNAVSQELNRIVEAEVLPAVVKIAKAGRRIAFVGCAEVRNEPGDLRPLKVVPLSATVVHPQAAP
jgi:predicted lipoprotein